MQTHPAAMLVVSSAAADHAVLDSIFSGSRWTVEHARTVHEAVPLLAGQVFPVVICAQSVNDGDWKDLRARLNSFGAVPSLLVTSRQPNNSLWTDVLSFGGCDVLMQPFDHREVVGSVGLAWRQWNSRQH